MAHNSLGLKEQLRTCRNSAMTELTIPSGVGAALKPPEGLEAGLRHKQIGRYAEASSTHRARLIETQDLIKLLTT